MRLVIFILVGLFLFSGSAFSIDSIELFTGYLGAPLQEKHDLRVVPLMLAINFDSNGFVKEKMGIDVSGELNFALEPFINPVISPDNNIEVGVNFLFKYVLPFGEDFKTYIKGGLGVLYMSQHTREQSTQYNFLPQAGMGVSYRISEKAAINFEYRYRHLSNAGFESPNKGIDANMFLTGIQFLF